MEDDRAPLTNAEIEIFLERLMLLEKYNIPLFTSKRIAVKMGLARFEGYSEAEIVKAVELRKLDDIPTLVLPRERLANPAKGLRIPVKHQIPFMPSPKFMALHGIKTHQKPHLTLVKK